MTKIRLTYGLVGRGRLARHLGFYLPLQGHRCVSWSRGQDADRLNSADTILVLAPDDAIEDFIRHAGSRHGLRLDGKTLIHASGSLATPLAYGAHPIMSFGPELYAPELYPKIPFALDDDAPDFSELFPNFSNPWVRIPKAQKALYHATLSVMANFAQLLWRGGSRILSREFGFEARLLRPLLEQSLANSLANPEAALTGPLIRGDARTLARHLAALGPRPESKLYEAFVRYFEATDSGPLRPLEKLNVEDTSS